MNATVWLKVTGKEKWGRWHVGPVTASKTKPTCRGAEIAVRLQIEIPDSIFEEPVYEAKIVMPTPSKIYPNKAEMSLAVGAALSDRMGFRVKVDRGEEGDAKEQ